MGRPRSLHGDEMAAAVARGEPLAAIAARHNVSTAADLKDRQFSDDQHPPDCRPYAPDRC